MADDLSFPPSNKKRKFDDRSPTPLPRGPTGFSSPISSFSHDAAAPAAYNNVLPPAEAFELARQKAQQIVASIFNKSEHKRPQVESGGDEDKGFDPPTATGQIVGALTALPGIFPNIPPMTAVGQGSCWSKWHFRQITTIYRHA